MSIRQRNTFKFSEDDHDNAPVLDEQEQEELINDLRHHSETRNAHYAVLLQTLVGVSAVLHLVYLFSEARESPFVAVLPYEATSSRPIPASSFFVCLALFHHANLVLHLFSPTHEVRRSVSSTFIGRLPLPYPLIFAASVIAPFLSLALWQSWADVLWWSTTAGLAYFIYSAQLWFDEEARAISELEKMRYDAKGA